MNKFLFSKPGLLIIFGAVFSWSIWFYLDTYRASNALSDKAAVSPASSQTAPSTPALGSKPSGTDATPTDLPNATKPASQPLNLQLEHLSAPLGSQQPEKARSIPLHEGPKRPETAKLPDSPSENSLLPDRSKPSENGVIYGYEGKEEESHKVTIGIHQDDVTVKTQIKAGEKDSEVQGIEIEVKLPK
ncbi:hypothetical protein [Thiomicrorhabdus cannonii]|uniref:hypothetical protein n=1 Tax=Thiomicrorhabdus cannonii TaxID=2748011 RepID=UPI0015BD1407|nr:hypothetical protein [Thiomicrorhabdus cannonii]